MLHQQVGHYYFAQTHFVLCTDTFVYPAYAAYSTSCRCCLHVQSGGTRGDVQPAVALGLQLAALGHHVRLAADKSFESFVKLHGLEYYPLAGDAKAMMQLTVKWG